MKIVLFCHSVSSDWNNGNAHFQRGVATELASRGHAVTVFEPADGWSAQNLVADAGSAALDGFRAVYPALHVQRYALDALDLEQALDGADLVIVHEWNPPELVRRLGQHRRTQGRYRLLFHDTHHRMVSAADAMRAFDFEHYDGVLAFGEVLRERYLRLGWGNRVWTWHEAADTRVFQPRPRVDRRGDLVWVGNFGDEERTRELREYLLEPAQRLGLHPHVFGVRYPQAAQSELAQAGAHYRGWLPNYQVPEVFAAFRVTVHVPRRPYAEALPGIPTIRVFEALATGTPLVSAPWQDSEGLFTPGKDFLMARSGSEMQQHLRAVLEDEAQRTTLVRHGLTTIQARHTCTHRASELLDICRELGLAIRDSAGPRRGAAVTTAGEGA